VQAEEEQQHTEMSLAAISIDKHINHVGYMKNKYIWRNYMTRI